MKDQTIARGAKVNIDAEELDILRPWSRHLVDELHPDIAHIGDDEEPVDIETIDLGGEAAWITAGDYHTCAIVEEHEIVCWGFNESGQLGYGDTETRGDDEVPAGSGGIDLL